MRRIVHVSVANPDASSPFPYFRGKAATEEALRAAGISHAIVRPTLVFGAEDILVNNIAWALRHVPVFLVAGDGRYEVQPVSVRDTARICVEAGAREDDVTLDAAGPERWTYEDFVRLIAGAVRARTWIRRSPSSVALAAARFAGLFLRDVVVTRDELLALEAGLLVSHEPPLGSDRFEAWLADNADTPRPPVCVRARAQLPMTATPLVLASTSPQRRAILEQLRIPFEVVAPDVRRGRPARSRTPTELVRAHAEGKARSVHAGRSGHARRRHGRRARRPRRTASRADGDDAARMLEELSGRTHTVVSGLCLLGPGSSVVEHERTDVTFRAARARGVAAYLESGEWEGRAGAYAIQGLGGRLVERIDGDYLNVVGLPGALLVDAPRAQSRAEDLLREAPLGRLRVPLSWRCRSRP